MTTLNDYQTGAGKTAVYPRVYTEDQIREIVWDVVYPYVEDADTAAWMENNISQALDERETAFNRLIYPVLGLLGEAGEIANKLKKVARDDVGIMSDEKVDAVSKEVGDVLWYVAATSTELGYSLDEVASANLNKLADRQERGVISGDGDER